MTLLLLCSPWLALGLFVLVRVRVPPGLPEVEKAFPESEALPSVSVVIPARDEENTIGPCVASLAASRYPDFEIVVVDDGSEDGTAEMVRSLEPGNARGIRLVSGKPLPAGWFGKPWACWQGAREATGDLLLFTDADTEHGPRLLARSVEEIRAGGADAVTVVGRQVMGSFWERLLQPWFFALLAIRYPRTGEPKEPGRWRDAIANGQYILFSRTAYDQVGGHEAVKGEVVEDMRLAQILVRGGRRLVVRSARELETRMYRSLGELVDGWSKNLGTAVLQTTPRWFHPVAHLFYFTVGLVLWLLPPAVLGWALLTGASGLPLHWSGIVTGFGVVFWAGISAFMGAGALHGLVYPLGALLLAHIYVRSWTRGSRIEWKGRAYRVPEAVRRGTMEGGEEGAACSRPDTSREA